MQLQHLLDYSRNNAAHQKRLHVAKVPEWNVFAGSVARTWLCYLGNAIYNDVALQCRTCDARFIRLIDSYWRRCLCHALFRLLCCWQSSC